MSSIMRCRGGLMALSVMRDAPVLMKVANPSSQDRTAPPRYRVGWVARRSALPRERFSPLLEHGHIGLDAAHHAGPCLFRDALGQRTRAKTVAPLIEAGRRGERRERMREHGAGADAGLQQGAAGRGGQRKRLFYPPSVASEEACTKNPG